VGTEELSAAEQTRVVLRIIEAALTQAGAGFEQVVRTPMFIAHPEDWEEIGRAHGEVFGTICPASTRLRPRPCCRRSLGFAGEPLPGCAKVFLMMTTPVQPDEPVARRLL
jgi:enamine deaminase RidA (YjgF/YER057c/UK114 family)